MDSLFSLAHRLLTYGLDGSPIYVDEFTRLNREVYEQALELYGTRGKTVESEAELCIYNHRTTKTNQKYPSVNL